ncbi:hemolysin [Paracoccus pantotrophus]|nr:hemolysin [Paracoccus pantotrophus]WGR65728.1 Hint domain-containing protein [Paracoccus pantotrophus]
MRLSEDTGVATIGFRAEIFESEIVCFTRGTLIECAEGPRPVESLRIGDLVRTLDNGLKPLRWIASCRLGRELKATPKLRPIRIRAGALGQGVPSSDLLVSPQHRILVRSRVAMRLFGTAEVLVAAKQLLMLDGVDIAQDLEAVEYFHFAFDRHEVVFANGAEAESLYPGTQALKAIGRSAREELFALFPDLREQVTPPVAAREIVSGRQGRRLAVRHLRNGRPLVAEAARPH